MSDSVWLLWFEQEREFGEDTELLIGVYRSEEAAKSAIGRLKISRASETIRRDSTFTKIF